MTKHKWNYCGDVSLAYGGYYWREDGANDYVLVVRVTPCSDAGGPDNLFWIEQGSLYIPDDKAELDRALSCIGWEKENGTPSRWAVIDALISYRGFDRDCMNGDNLVRLGPPQQSSREFGDKEPNVILRANASLKNYVKNNFLR